MNDAIKNGILSTKTLIIGSRGRMGSMFLEQAAKQGLDVAGIDVPFENMDQTCAKINLALFCVPIIYLEATLKRIIPFLPKNAILADITSVKEEPLRLMKKYWNGPIVGTHPLFGPSPAPGDDLPVTLVKTDATQTQDLDKVKTFFEILGCRCFEADAATHDKAMARIQNMNFITNLAYFAAISGQKELLPFLTPSFHRREKAAKKMLTEDAEMFGNLFEANNHSHEAVRQFRRMLNVAASGDIELLCEKAQWWWKDQNEKDEKNI